MTLGVVMPSGGCRRQSPWVGHDGGMGSAGDKPRKRRHPLPKVPKYEEPNSLPLAGSGGSGGAESGRFGHGSDHNRNNKPGRAGSFLLRMLGMGKKD